MIGRDGRTNQTGRHDHAQLPAQLELQRGHHEERPGFLRAAVVRPDPGHDVELVHDWLEVGRRGQQNEVILPQELSRLHHTAVQGIFSKSILARFA